MASEPFIINRSPGGRVTGGEPAGREPERILMGSLPYDTFSVLYDARAGIIGIKRRTD